MRRITLLSCVVLGLLLAPRASAHDPFEITSDAHVDERGLNLHTTLSLETAARICLVEAESRARFTRADFEPARARFESCARAYYMLSAGGKPLALRSLSLSLSAEDDLEMRALYARPAASPLRFEAVGLKGLRAGAGVVLTVTGQRTFLGQKLLSPDDTRLELEITDEGEAPGTPPVPTFARFLRLGFEHILSGADHLMFLLGLLVLCRRWRTAAILVSCFTLAHSLTLALAAFDVIRLSSRIAEPLIAATVVLVGIENLFLGREPEGRWLSRSLLTFAFGLVHGLGFASALRGLEPGALGPSLGARLLAFNLGVELGQLAVACVLLALFWRLSALGRFSRLPRWLSLGVTLFGLFWFIQRVAT
ncbi:MAG TPA: HupE/UreJ family protein [Polyangiaceae bacterium]|nr:HupE/UreJ family protein [Polyangiaceae bacterium]